jgi:hypothetical protein
LIRHETGLCPEIFINELTKNMSDGKNSGELCRSFSRGDRCQMSQILSPEHSKQELEGGLELEELADRLEGEEMEEVQGFDLVYSKDRRKSSQEQGSTYRLQESGSEWYDDEALEEIQVEGPEIDIQEVKMNAVTGETVLVDSSGQETRYDIFSSFEGTTTFTQEVGRNKYVFRYEKEEDEVKAVEAGGDMEPSCWGNEELKNRVELIDNMYHKARERLWERNEPDEKINYKNSNFDQLRPVYNWVKARIDRSENDLARIEKDDHVGSTKGIHIVQDFKKAVRRAEEDSIENYSLDENENYPMSIKEK